MSLNGLISIHYAATSPGKVTEWRITHDKGKCGRATLRHAWASSTAVIQRPPRNPV